ncbi:sulfotransferase [Thiorhodovibrio frisius]|uniref:Sulfotransferase family protein n=1 Tax=Thiorhodovibrio frisius TaxID=631362 RepID=H8YZW5_9GAMM|nr:sulfotransferase [Thiorhodovibrio frisius]EIC22242.1 hypothetical protein Thi970DRAFT_02495 [Thiorhodovibrio frisius]WPL24537.1 hypothetical protein Thiofri_04757 [Thiorhodovibrio frisius]
MPLSSPGTFVLSSPNSGGSRFVAMLGQHTDCYGPLSLNLMATERLVDLLDTLPSGGLHGLLRTVAQLYAGEQTLETIDMAKRWLYRRAHHKTAEVLREIMNRVAPRVLVEFSSLYSDTDLVTSLERIYSAFPDARYLHLTCHPVSQGSAWLRDSDALARLHQLRSLDDQATTPIPDPQIDWYRRNRSILDFLGRIPKKNRHHLRIEDLGSDARTSLARLSAWLGIAWNEQQFESMLHPDNSVFACPGPFGAEGGAEAEFIAQPAFVPENLTNLFPAAPSLEQRLPWRPDGSRLRTETIDLAGLFGYE